MRYKISLLFFTIILVASVPQLTRAAVFNIVYNNQTFTVDDQTLSHWQGTDSLIPSNAFRPAPQELNEQVTNLLADSGSQTLSPKNFHYQISQIYDFISSLANKINLPVVEPKLTIENNTVTEFIPPQNGTRLDVYQSTLLALNSLETSQATSTLVVYTARPQNSLSSMNNLGITELIGHGVSNFKGSPSNRRHNIKVGVEKMTGLIVPQGATFSFNDHLGPVDGEHGFLPELVIKKEGTIPEFGGGLCQVSTTTFRAAMDAGFPITARRNHAYAVSYYSPQGTDATIYPGSADLKFVNDSPGAILIWPYLQDTNTLVFDFYGTKDGRQVTLEKPVQFDRKPDGSLKASWTRVVIKDGVSSTSTFNSVYQPPALFHKTESFVSATGTITSTLTVPKTP